MDTPVIFDRLAESTTPHINKTRSLGVEVATTESHLRETTAIFGYCSLFLLHHSNRFKFSVAQELSMSTRYDRTSCLTSITICSLANLRRLSSALLLSAASTKVFLLKVNEKPSSWVHILHMSFNTLCILCAMVWDIRLAFSAINTHRIF